jgi:uncharacterized protein YcbK (DUF882 family)
MKHIKRFSSTCLHGSSNRRHFLKAGLVMTAAGCLFPNNVFAEAAGFFTSERKLSFYNTHTGESLKTAYSEQGGLVPEALSCINHILRDFRTGEVKEIDTGLLDILFTLQQKLKSTEPFHIISGYRSPETNLILRTMSRGVAQNSLHLDGKAIDIRLPGYDLKTLHCAAVGLKMGGVGYYPSQDFVHVDVGRVRYW